MARLCLLPTCTSPTYPNREDSGDDGHSAGADEYLDGRLHIILEDRGGGAGSQDAVRSAARPTGRRGGGSGMPGATRGRGCGRS